MRLHHIGVVVDSIDEQVEYYQEYFNFKVVFPKTLDPKQDAYIAFMQGDGATVLTELIEPASDDSPVANALKKGGGLNHVCYAVPSLEKAIDAMTDRGAILIKPPTPAIAFQERHVAFLYTRAKEIVELVEDEK